jgi:hypothetical protein
MSHWKEIDDALNSELESFDRFMTGRNIGGGNAETMPEKEVRKLEDILEKPLPERFVQQKLLDYHSI